jgi:hypothetical protein
MPCLGRPVKSVASDGFLAGKTFLNRNRIGTINVLRKGVFLAITKELGP